LFLKDDASAEELSEAMDEAKESPLLSRDGDLAYTYSKPRRQKVAED